MLLRGFAGRRQAFSCRCLVSSCTCFAMVVCACVHVCVCECVCECVKENVCEDVDEEYERGGVVTHSIVEYRESEELKRRKNKETKSGKLKGSPV